MMWIKEKSFLNLPIAAEKTSLYGGYNGKMGGSSLNNWAKLILIFGFILLYLFSMDILAALEVYPYIKKGQVNSQLPTT